MTARGDSRSPSMDDLFDALEGAGETLALGLVRGTEDREVEVALTHFSS